MDQELREALKTILRQPPKGLMAYAQTYADACFNLGDATGGTVERHGAVIEIKPKETGKEMAGNELRTQLLYVLSNLDHWRGEEARRVKGILRKYAT